MSLYITDQIKQEISSYCFRTARPYPPDEQSTRETLMRMVHVGILSQEVVERIFNGD